MCACVCMCACVHIYMTINMPECVMFSEPMKLCISMFVSYIFLLMFLMMKCVISALVMAMNCKEMTGTLPYAIDQKNTQSQSEFKSTTEQ